MALSDFEDEYGESSLGLDESDINKLFATTSDRINSGNDPSIDPSVETSANNNHKTKASDEETAATIANKHEVPSSLSSAVNTTRDAGGAIATGIAPETDAYNVDSIPERPTFEISPAILETALSLAPGRRPYWSHQMYRGTQNEEAQVHYCKTHMQSEMLARKFLKEPILGFDMEWRTPYRPGIKQNISLIQLASERHIGLFHIAMHYGTQSQQLMAPSLRKILESPEILKTGVGIFNADGKRLEKFFKIHPQGLFELSHLHNLVQHLDPALNVTLKKSLVSLAKLVQFHLHLPLHKGPVRTSDWSKPLNWEQINYAASDAYAGFQLFRIMDAKKTKLMALSTNPLNVELELPTRLIESSKEETQIVSVTNEPDQEESQGGSLSDKARASTKQDALKSEDDPMFVALNAHRYQIASETGVRPQVVLQDSVLERLAAERPSNTESILRIRGIGAVKVKKYGSQWLEILARRQEEECQGGAPNNKSSLSGALSEYKAPETALDPTTLRKRRFIPPEPLRLYKNQDGPGTKRLSSALFALRIQISDKMGLGRDAVAGEKLLEDLATQRPCNTTELEKIDGSLKFSQIAASCGVDVLAFLAKYAPAELTTLTPLDAIENHSQGYKKSLAKYAPEGKENCAHDADDEDGYFGQIAVIPKKRRK